MLLNLNFVNNTFLLCFFFFFLIIDLYFLTAAAIAQIFNLIAEIVIPIEIPTKEEQTKIEIHAITTEVK